VRLQQGPGKLSGKVDLPISCIFSRRFRFRPDGCTCFFHNNDNVAAFLAGKASPVALHLGFINIILFRAFLTNGQHHFPLFNMISLAVRLLDEAGRSQVTLLFYRVLLDIGQIKIPSVRGWISASADHHHHEYQHPVCLMQEEKVSAMNFMQ